MAETPKEPNLDLVREGVGLVRRMAEAHVDVARDLERSSHDVLTPEERVQLANELRRDAETLAAVADAAQAYVRPTAAVSGSGSRAMIAITSIGNGKTFRLPGGQQP